MYLILNFYNFYNQKMFLRKIFISICLLALCACNTTELRNYSSNPNDPFEKTNRKIHAFNKHIDETTLKPASKIYGNVIPRPVRLGAANFYENLQEPKRFVNHLGQAEFIKATTDVSRFIINSSVGIFGIFDVASRISLFSDDTEFDETFAYWGLPVGPYLELPFIGPSSIRGSMSMLVDYTLNPMSLLSGPAEGASLITFGALDILNKRHDLEQWLIQFYTTVWIVITLLGQHIYKQGLMNHQSQWKII